MLSETFYLDGVDAASVGIRLQAPLSFSAAEREVRAIKVPGRNGNLLMDTGAYKNRRGFGDCFALADDLPSTLDAASGFLLDPTGGYRRLECSNDPAHFWRARVINGASVEDRMRHLNPFRLQFDCCPQKFLTIGENSILYKKPDVLWNIYGTDALPFIEVHGQGAGAINIGGTEVQIISMTEVLYLDCEAGVSYNKTEEDQSGNIFIPSLDFPSLHPGDNTISFSGGVTEVIIIPRWWAL